MAEKRYSRYDFQILLDIEPSRDKMSSNIENPIY